MLNVPPDPRVARMRTAFVIGGAIIVIVALILSAFFMRGSIMNWWSDLLEWTTGEVQSKEPIAVIATNADGVQVWYEGHPGGAYIEQPALPGGAKVLGVARGGTTTMVLGQDASGSAFYSYANGAYTEEHRVAATVIELDIARDGQFVSYVTETENGSELSLFNRATGTTVALGLGHGARFLTGVHGEPVVVYVQEKRIIARVYANATWGPAHVVYNALIEFISPIATDRASKLALTDPASGSIQEWEVRAAAGLVHARPVTAHPYTPHDGILYREGALTAYINVPDNKDRPALSFVFFPAGAPERTATLSAPSNIANPLYLMAINP